MGDGQGVMMDFDELNRRIVLSGDPVSGTFKISLPYSMRIENGKVMGLTPDFGTAEDDGTIHYLVLYDVSRLGVSGENGIFSYLSNGSRFGVSAEKQLKDFLRVVGTEWEKFVLAHPLPQADEETSDGH